VKLEMTTKFYVPNVLKLVIIMVTFIFMSHIWVIFYYLIKEGGGYCDCGDMASLKPESICKLHKTEIDY